MAAWRNEIIGALMSARGCDEAFAAIALHAKEWGFDYCAYGGRLPLPICRPAFFLINNYPEEWQRVYRKSNYLRIDPTVQQGLRRATPILWSDLADTEHEFWAHAREFGLQHGWSQASHDAGGTVGMLTVAREHEPIGASELVNVEHRLKLLAHAAHSVMSGFALPAILPESASTLSPREREVLRWTAEGKTCYEIGMILGLTERTVNFHVNRAVCKLDASNKTHATVKAALLGILS
ncbi:Transcriptional activator protein SolR [Paraburkholderia ribeironis]|uniref:Transcriptional activator protein SolR n=2 Tax=Paraburkholderia ribeironis TaxID=1247936 RepID=A0A1N7RY95_9BURK|nr:Transcriptional activator protein SolR [Paraburkholderia ribeironis]